MQTLPACGSENERSPSVMNRIARSATPRRVVFAALAGAIVGCASAPAPAPVPTGNLNAPAPISPQTRAEFDEAMQLIGAGNYEKGMELLRRVASQSQNNAVPHINLAIVNMKKGKLDDAENNLKKALEIDPDNPVANNELGILYRKTGRFAEARTTYEKLLGKYPRYPVANKNLAILCDLYLRDYECALRGYTAYSNALPDDKNARIWMADVHKRLGTDPRAATVGNEP